jgi:hypothetical protein
MSIDLSAIMKQSLIGNFYLRKGFGVEGVQRDLK